MPATIGSQIKGPCSRIDLMKQHAGIDVQELYPAGVAAEGGQLDTDAFLKAAEACHKAGVAFGVGLGQTSELGRHRGRVLPVVRRRAGRRQGQHHGQVRRGAAGARILHKAREVLSAGCAGLGRCLQQQVAGVRQGRADHEPAERLGGGQARRAEDRRAVLDPRHAGRVRRAASRRSCPTSGAIWNFAKNKPAAKSLLVHLSQPRAVEKLVAASGGYDLPSFDKLTTLKTWAEEGPPKGTLYHYPNPHNHQTLSVAAARRRPRSRSRSTRRRSRPR